MPWVVPFSTRTAYGIFQTSEDKGFRYGRIYWYNDPWMEASENMHVGGGGGGGGVCMCMCVCGRVMVMLPTVPCVVCTGCTWHIYYNTPINENIQ